MVKVETFGPGARFHHLAVGVRSIREHCQDCEILNEPTQNVNVAFVEMNGMCMELVEPANDKSPILGSLDKGMKLLHVCFEVDEIEAALEIGREHGFRVMANPVVATSMENCQIAWTYSPTYGVVELIESMPSV